jgi:hypothetical protein
VRTIDEPAELAAPELRLRQAELETVALNAFFGVLSHSYRVRTDDLGST